MTVAVFGGGRHETEKQRIQSRVKVPDTLAGGGATRNSDETLSLQDLTPNFQLSVQRP